MVPTHLTGFLSLYLNSTVAVLLTWGLDVQGLNCSGDLCSINVDSKIKDDGTNEASPLVSGLGLSNTSNVEDATVFCKIGKNSRAKNLKCFQSSRRPVDCNESLSADTLVTFSCPEFYTAKSPVVMCQHNGKWSEPITCEPECGEIKAPGATPLVMYGRQVSQGQWPWAAVLYFWNTTSTTWDYKCGGTLITDNMVLTAAHCILENFSTRKPNSTYFSIRLGTLTKDYLEKDENTYKVKRIYLIPVYHGDLNGFNSDIAILVLDKLAKLTENVLPACLPYHSTVVKPFMYGVVAGWGLNEYLKPMEDLAYIKVPIVDVKHCEMSTYRRFKKYLSFTSFCAGFRNGTGVCNGDSGSGLMVHDQVTDKWMIQGIVSLSPMYSTRGKDDRCHPRNYALYTKVKMFVEWIRTVWNFENTNFPQEDEVDLAIA